MTLAFTSFKPSAFAALATPEGVYVLSRTQLVLHDVMLFLLLYVFCDRCFIQAYRTYIVPFGPKLPVAELVLQVGMLIENHQRTFALQIANKTRHAYLRGDTYQHVHMIRHEVTLKYFNPLVFTQISQYLPYAFTEGCEDYFSPILRRKHDMILAQPFCMS